MNAQRCRALAPVLALLLATAAGRGQEPAAPVQGRLTDDAAWSGEVLVVGDVEVPLDGRLVIRAGTTIRVAGTDQSRAGWNPERIEIHVKGQLVVEGTVAAPVRILPAEPAPPPRRRPAVALPIDPSLVPARTPFPTWHGIVLHVWSEGPERRCRITGLHAEGAIAALQLPQGSPVVEDCVFLDCATGIEVGCAYKDQRFRGAEGGVAMPEIQRCRFAHCITGVYAEGRATPQIRRSVFYQCGVGVGSQRPGYTQLLEKPGCSVRECALIGNRAGVFGSAVVHDSILLDNDAAARLSDYHDHLATDIDQIALDGNLVHGGAMPVRGDAGVGRRLLRGDPRFRGPLAELGAPGVPLPASLTLEEGSAAIGAASHGGDLGPLAVARPGGDGARRRGRGAPLLPCFAAASDPRGAWRKVGAVKPGQELGSSWWARAAQDERGLVDLKQTFGATRPEGLLAGAFALDRAQSLRLWIDGDLERAEVVLNGAPVETLDGRRRHGGGGRAVALPARAGSNLLVLEVRGWSTTPRLVLDLEGDWQPLPAAQSQPENALQSSRILALKGESFVELTFTRPVHWGDAGRSDVARVRREGQTQERPVELTCSGPLRIRAGPLPKDLARTDFVLALVGLRDAAGRTVKVDPVRLRAP